MDIHERPIAELIEAEYNPRQLTTEQYEHLKSSMLRFGCVDPLIVNQHPDRKDIIVGGHQRLRVWKDLGKDTIPCTYVNLPLDKERELNVRLNRNTGEWDWDALADNFDVEQLVEWGFDENELGLQEGEPVDLEPPSDGSIRPAKCPKCGFEFEVHT